MLYTVNHSQAQEAIKIGIQANTVTFMKGSPAIGKSSIVHNVAKELNMEVIDLRLTQLQPYDLNGLPTVNKNDHTTATYAPMDIFPLEHTPLPEGKQGWLLFLDEFNSADKYTAAAAYKLLLDRMVGQYKLHPNVRIVCAGNKMTDGAITHNLGTAIQSRVTHLELQLIEKDWLNWLDTQNWHTMVSSFLHFRPTLINNFDPKKEVITYASPRTWELLSKQLNVGLLSLQKETYLPIIAGIIGERAAVDFISYVELFGSLPSLNDIVADPDNCIIPDSIGAKWALISFLADNIKPINEQAIVKYLFRLTEVDILVAGLRSIAMKYPNIRANVDVQNKMRELRNQVR